MLKKWIWDGLGLHLGGGWDALGRLLDTLGRLWAIFWAFNIELCTALVQDGLQEGFWIDFGSILEGICEDLGRIWEGLGRIWTNFGMDFGKIGGRIWMSVKEFEQSWGRVSK